MLVGFFGALITIVKSAEKDGELHFQVLIPKTRLLEGELGAQHQARKCSLRRSLELL